MEDDGCYCSPLVPVKKKGESDGVRMCLDFRKLNKKIKVPSYPLPHMKNILYRVRGLRWFSTIDLIKGYFQVPLTERCQEYTAFSFMGGKFKFVRLPQGLACSSGAFQQAMDRIVCRLECELKGVSSMALCFVDDIMIGSETFEGHLGAVRIVLNALCENGLKVKLSKAEWSKSEVGFLGHVIGNDKIRKSPEFINKILDLPRPRTVGEMRSFLGLINFHRNFIDHCAEVTNPLTDMLSMGDKTKIQWEPEIERAYENVKNEAVREVELMAPDWSENGSVLMLYVDASAYATGAKLVQAEGDRECIIGYSSKKLSSAQRGYSATDRELCAIRWGIEAFEDFLRLKRFEVYTDHKALVFLFNMKNRNSRLVRTLEYLSDFQFTVRYVPGRENLSADLLSRLGPPPDLGSGEESLELPEGFTVREVPGGGSSLFEAMSLLFPGDSDDKALGAWLSSDQCFRDELSRLLIERGDFLGLSLSNGEKSRIKEIAKSKEFLPCVFIFSLAVKLNLVIFLFVGGSIPICFIGGTESTEAVALQLLDGCHYNALFWNGGHKFQRSIILGGVSYNVQAGEGEPAVGVSSDWEPEELRLSSKSVVGAIAFGVHFNVLLDTGSEVCLLSSELYTVLKEKIVGSGGYVEEFAISVRIEGFGGATELRDSIGVTLSFYLGNLWMRNVKFLVLDESKMFYQVILGANIIKRERLEINYGTGTVSRDGAWICDFDDCLSTVRVSVAWDSPMPSLNHQVPRTVGSVAVRVAHFLDPVSIARIQDSDPRIVSMKRWVGNGGAWPPDLKYCIWLRTKLSLKGNVLIFKSQGREVPYMPESFVIPLALEVHRNSMHAGRGKLMFILQEQVMGERLRKIVSDITRCCPVCQLRKISGIRYQPPTLKVETNHPFQVLGMDTVALPRTSSGYIAILTVIDYYSSFGWAVPVKRKDGKSVVHALRERILPSVMGRVGKFISDSGFEFTSNALATFLEEQGIRHTFVTTYHPQSAGKIERMNGSIVRMLNVSSADAVDDWVERLSDVMIVYNETRHESIGMSPVQFLLTRSHEVSDRGFTSPGFRKVWREGHPKYAPYKVGDSVLVRRNYIGNRVSIKLSPRYSGPYKVVKCNRDGVSYVVLDPVTQAERLAHHVQLRTWYDIPEYIRGSEGYHWYQSAFLAEIGLNAEHDEESERDGDGSERGTTDNFTIVMLDNYWERRLTVQSSVEELSGIEGNGEGKTVYEGNGEGKAVDEGNGGGSAVDKGKRVDVGCQTDNLKMELRDMSVQCDGNGFPDVSFSNTSSVSSLLGFFERLPIPSPVHQSKYTKRGRIIPIDDDMPSQNLRRRNN